jgi:hypothetical protein
LLSDPVVDLAISLEAALADRHVGRTLSTAAGGSGDAAPFQR